MNKLFLSFLVLCASVTLAQEPTTKTRLYVVYLEGCVPCTALHKGIAEQLVPKGWTVGEDDSCHIHFINGDSVLGKKLLQGWQYVPTVVLQKNDENYITIHELPSTKHKELSVDTIEKLLVNFWN